MWLVPGSLQRKGQYWGHLLAHLKYREYPACAKVIQWVAAVIRAFAVSTAATCYCH